MDTSASLLDRLRVADAAPADWERLVALYTPLIHGWLRRRHVRPVDADDLVQDVLAVVVRRLPAFRHNERAGAFRAWLRAIAVNCLRTNSRKQRGQLPGDFETILDELADPASGLSREWDREHDLHVTRELLRHIEPTFTAKTWAAFRGVALDGRSAADVAAELDMTAGAVFVAKSRVLTKLRAEAAGLVDEN